MAVANAQTKMDFWQEMARVAEGGAESSRQAIAEAPATGRGRTQFNVHEDLPGSEKNNNFEDNNKSRKDGRKETAESDSGYYGELLAQEKRDGGDVRTSEGENARFRRGDGKVNAIADKYEIDDANKSKSEDSIFPEEFNNGACYGKLKSVDNGLASNVDKNGAPSIIIAHYSDTAFCHLYKDRGRWAAEVMNKDLSKRQFVELTARAIDALPDNARLYEGTSISVDGMRVFMSRLRHGFKKSGRFFNEVVGLVRD